MMQLQDREFSLLRFRQTRIRLPSFEKQHMGDAGSEVDCGRGAELHDPRAGRGGLGVTTAEHKYASPAPRPTW
ncbi:hypothetical protein RD149_23080 [Gordonia westfalica]|uniref:Uncharacterized protein n=1 Tax=Gordonia westfalica TaxID=158898 RepID=A0ABU2GYU4_9ACTN|nr:hypothetical protein [Gordonia westfalica]MDS1116636.1 hypothetical protein [Gordonia westfalica]